MEKSSEEAIELFEALRKNSQQFSSKGRQRLKGKGMHEESTNGGVQTQMSTMERKLDMIVKAMTSHNFFPIQQIAQVKVCTICSHLDHTNEMCPMFSIVDQKLKKNDLEDAMIQFLTAQQQTNDQTSQAIQRLEAQVRKLAKELSEGEGRISSPNNTQSIRSRATKDCNNP
jgi:hypothetical protein